MGIEVVHDEVHAVVSWYSVAGHGSEWKETPNNLTEVGLALINTARACAEAIGLSDEHLKKEMPDLEPHCGTGGKSVESQLRMIPEIQNGWMRTGIPKALEEFRAQPA